MSGFHSLGKTEYSQIDGELALIRLDSLRSELRSDRSVEPQIQVDLLFCRNISTFSWFRDGFERRTDLDGDIDDRFYEY